MTHTNWFCYKPWPEAPLWLERCCHRITIEPQTSLPRQYWVYIWPFLYMIFSVYHVSSNGSPSCLCNVVMPICMSQVKEAIDSIVFHSCFMASLQIPMISICTKLLVLYPKKEFSDASESFCSFYSLLAYLSISYFNKTDSRSSEWSQLTPWEAHKKNWCRYLDAQGKMKMILERWKDGLHSDIFEDVRSNGLEY